MTGRPRQHERTAAMNRYEDFRYVMLITYGRSGSTLLQNLLNAIPGYLVRGENDNALYHLYRAAEAVRVARNVHGWQPTGPGHPWYGADRLTPVPFRARMLEAFVDGVLKPEHAVRVLGCKEIRHTPFFMTDDEFADYMQFLLDALPGCRIVFNSRGADAVAQSGWMAERDPASVARDVAACDRRFSAFAASHPMRTLHLTYEDYVTDRAPIRQLFEFLEEAYDEARVEAVFAERLSHH